MFSILMKDLNDKVYTSPHIKPTKRSKWEEWWALWRTGIKLKMVMNNWKKDQKWKILNSVMRGAKDCIQKGEIKCRSTWWKATDCRAHPQERAFTSALFAARRRCDLTPLLSGGTYWFKWLQKSIHYVLKLSKSQERGTAKKKFKSSLLKGAFKARSEK